MLFHSPHEGPHEQTLGGNWFTWQSGTSIDPLQLKQEQQIQTTWTSFWLVLRLQWIILTCSIKIWSDEALYIYILLSSVTYAYKTNTTESLQQLCEALMVTANNTEQIIKFDR